MTARVLFTLLSALQILLTFGKNTLFDVFKNPKYLFVYIMAYFGKNHIRNLKNFSCQFRMYEVSPSILEARLLGSGNQILDAAVVGIPNQENGQVMCTYEVCYIYFRNFIRLLH